MICSSADCAAANLQLVITDGCPGLARALETVYPRARHQRCWVHKMRNILEKVRRRDEDAGEEREAQRIYLARHAAAARRRLRAIPVSLASSLSGDGPQLERDLPELLNFFDFPQPLWRKLRTTNVIERCFVEVRRRTRPMVVFTNVESVDRIIYAIFSRSTRTGKTAPSIYLHKQLDVTAEVPVSAKELHRIEDRGNGHFEG